MSNFENATALLIGVGAYPRFATLPATVRDAQAIAAVLTDPARCGYPPETHPARPDPLRPPTPATRQRRTGPCTSYCASVWN